MTIDLVADIISKNEDVLQIAERPFFVKKLRMIKSGETVLRQSRRGCRNSQAKGPVLDGTLESRKAPKKQSGYRRIFQVSDRGMDRYKQYLCVPLFFYCNKANSTYKNRGQKTILNCKEEKDENRH